MTSARCRWCGQPATEQCRAGKTTILYCVPGSRCWERTYREVRGTVPRTWGPATRPGRQKPPEQATLFD